jgi:hypothetical protein
MALDALSQFGFGSLRSGISGLVRRTGALGGAGGAGGLNSATSNPPHATSRRSSVSNGRVTEAGAVGASSGGAAGDIEDGGDGGDRVNERDSLLLSSLESGGGGSSSGSISSTGSGHRARGLGASASTQAATSTQDAAVVFASREYLFRMRVCSLVEMVFLWYRLALPVQCWGAYFSHSMVPVAIILKISYYALKIMDLSGKLMQVASAIYRFINNDLVRNTHITVFCVPLLCCVCHF